MLEGKVVTITGAGGGLGRAHALEVARLGARVIVNDVGGDLHGRGGDSSAAHAVVEEIESTGGKAIADTGDISQMDSATGLVHSALEAFEHLDAVVNNAGILRDRTLVNMEPADWDAVLAVHLRGTYAVTRAAAQHWRSEVKAGKAVDARVVCTSSASDLYGNPGQANYAAAKSGMWDSC